MEIPVRNWRDLYSAFVEANNQLSPDNVPMGTFRYDKILPNIVRCEMVFDLVVVEPPQPEQLLLAPQPPF